MNQPQKLYCYVDETGQDTHGRFFLVAVIIVDRALNEELQRQLLEIERLVRKRSARWARNNIRTKTAYLEQVLSLSLEASVFYTIFENTTSYITHIGDAVVRATQEKVAGDYRFVAIEIDALQAGEAPQVRKVLKHSQIRYNKLRGIRDEASPFIHLADAFAGFIRDYHENEPYATDYFPRFERRRIVKRV